MVLLAALAAPLDRAQAQAGFVDLSVTVDDAPDPVEPDGDITYTVTVTSHIPQDTAATVEMQNSGTLRFQSLTQPAGWTCNTPAVGAAPSVVCTHPTFGEGAAEFTMVARADAALIGAAESVQTDFSVTSAHDDMIPGNNSATAVTTITRPHADLAVTLDGPANAGHSEQLTYTISLMNSGPEAAPDVVMAGAPHMDMTFVSLTAPGGWSCTTPAVGASGAVACENASVASGSTADFTLVMTAPGSGDQTVTAVTVASAMADQDLTNNEAAVITALASAAPAPEITGVSPNTGKTSGGADVIITGQNFTGATEVTFGGTAAWSFQVDTANRISATAPAHSAGPVTVAVTTPDGTGEAANAFTYMAAPSLTVTGPAGTVYADDEFEFTLTVTNNNDAAIEDLTVNWPETPAGFTFAGAAASQGTADVTSASLGSLAAGASATVTVGYSIDGPGQLMLTASTSATNAPPAEASSSAVIVEEADLSVTLNGPASASVGELVGVLVSASNGGPTAASDVEVTVSLPATVTFVSLSAQGLSCTTPAVGVSGDVICEISRLGPASISFDVGVKVSQSEPDHVAVTATVSTSSPDPDATNDSARAEFLVTGGAPTAENVTVSTTYETEKTINLGLGGIVTSVDVVDPPAHGATSISGTTITYTPESGFYGEDSFTYTASGPGGTSAEATVTVTVGLPPPPELAEVDANVPYDSSGTAIELLVTGVFLTVQVGDAEHGEVTVEGTTATYTPDEGYFGQDSFTYTAFAPGTIARSATVNVTVATPAAPSVANVTGAAVPYNSSGTAIPLTVTGVYTSVSVVDDPGHGEVTISGTTATYVPPAGYYGPDSFTVKASGPGGDSTLATVEVSVATPAAPTVQNPPPLSLTMTLAQPNPTTTINLSNHVTGVFTAIEVATQPQHGTVSLATATNPGQPPMVIATYTATAASAVTDTFTFVAKGPGGDSQPGTVTVNIGATTPVLPTLYAVAIAGMASGIDLTGATNGPFTGAAVVSISPADSAQVTLMESGPPGNRTYRLVFQPIGNDGGQVVVNYTLSNIFGPSAPGQVIFDVIARPEFPDLSVKYSARVQVDLGLSLVEGAGDLISNHLEDEHEDDPGAQGEQDDENESGKGKKKGKGKGKKKGGSALNLSGLRFNGLSDLPAPDLDGPFPGLTARLEAEHARDDWFLNVPAPQAAQTSEDGGSPGVTSEYSGPLSAWASGSITFGRRDATGQADITLVSSGVAAGLDLRLSSTTLVGAGVGYGREITDIGRDGSRVEGISWTGFVYGSASPAHGLFVDGWLGGGELSLDIDRTVPETNALTTAERDADLFFAGLASGFKRREETWSLSSYGRLSFGYVDLGEYTEEGGGPYSLTYAEREAQSLTGALGVRGQVTHELRSGVVMPRARLEILHEFQDYSAQSMRYADWADGPILVIPGGNSARDRIRIGIGNAAILQNGWTVEVDAEADLASDQVLGRFRLKAEKEF